MSDRVVTPTEGIRQSELTIPLQKMFKSHEIEIIEWEQRVLTEGATSGAMVTRLTGKVRLDGKAMAWSLIRKRVYAPPTGPSDPPDAKVLSSNDYWKREWLLYRSGIFDDLPKGLAVPNAFHLAEEPDGYSLWTEDVRDEIGSIWPLSHYGTVAYHLGLLHAPYLIGKLLPNYPWLTRDIVRQREQSILSRDQLNELRRHPDVRRTWPDEVAEGMLAIWDERESFFQVTQQLPAVFQHGDCGRKNLMARYSKDGDAETVAIDWGYSGIGCLGEDLACLVGSSALWFYLTAEELAEVDKVAFAGYVQGLQAAGWRGDPMQARLGYTTAATLRYAIIPIVEKMALTQEGRDWLVKAFGHSVEEIADNLLMLRRFAIARAGETRRLMASRSGA